MLSLLVIPVGFQSFIFFFGFAVMFFGLSYKYTFVVTKWIYRKVRILLYKLKIVKALEVPKKEKIVKNSKNKKNVKNVQKGKENKTVKNKEEKFNWTQFNHENISYCKKLKQIKLNTKIFEFEQIEKIDLIVNSKKIEIKELKKFEKIKNIEIKIAKKIKKVTYRHFKYNLPKDNVNKFINKVVKDYKKLDKILKLNKKNIG